MNREASIAAALREIRAGKASIREAAGDFSVPRSTLQDRLKRSNIEYPEFTDERESIDSILERALQRHKRKRDAANSKKWFTIKLNENKPYGLLWFGDPHLDDDGTNWTLLQKHVEIARDHEAIYCGNIGDTTNRWVGRLMAKYADQQTTWTDADRLAEWFMYESGCSWLVWLLGNHDVWNRGAEFYNRLGAHHVPVVNWRAQFKIKHPSGTELRVDASHGRKGKSIYNELHGTLRDAMMGEDADLFVTGHTHNYAMEHVELAHKQKTSWLLQLRGYKEMDDYALTNGFPEHHHGSAILVIVDPRKGARSIIHHCFEDIEAGAAYLKTLRSNNAVDANPV